MIIVVNNFLETYFANLGEDLPATDPQQDLYFFLEPQGQALFLEGIIYTPKKITKISKMKKL